jgi:hypothetical protein
LLNAAIGAGELRVLPRQWSRRNEVVAVFRLNDDQQCPRSGEDAGDQKLTPF